MIRPTLTTADAALAALCLNQGGRFLADADGRRCRELAALLDVLLAEAEWERAKDAAAAAVPDRPAGAEVRGKGW